jgi:hypothetical protein
MAAIIQNNFDKVKNGIKPYLHDNQISPYLDLVESKIPLERSVIALSMSLLYSSLIFG